MNSQDHAAVWYNRPQRGLDRWVGFGTSVFAMVAFALVVFFLLRGGSPYPYTDDWGLVPFGTGETQVTVAWLWEPHVDHRLPIPKALWVAALRLSDLDFRAVMLLNAVIALVASFFVLKAFSSLRGHPVLSDLVVPLILLNPSFNIFQWGFYLQFILSISLMLLALALGSLHFSSAKRGYAIAASIAIFCLNGVGMNGTAMALVLAPTLAVSLIWHGNLKMRAEAQAALAVAVMTLIVAIYIVTTWSPSGASSQTGEMLSGLLERLGALLQPLFELSMPRAWAAPAVLPSSVYLACGVVLAASTTLVLGLRIVRGPTALHLYLAGSFVASWAVIGAIVIGRVGIWSPGIEYHYGYFPALPVLVALMVLSLDLASRNWQRTLRVCALVLFGSMYVNGVYWMLERTETRAQQLTKIRTDLERGRALDAIAADNISLFWWKHDAESVAFIAEKLLLLPSMKPQQSR